MIDSRTEVYGVIGDPVGHSLSPLMQNRAFRAAGINAVYAAFPVTDLACAIAGVRALRIRGLSVTIPHKEAIIPLLDEVDPLAGRIGAVNTVLNRQGRLAGYNTDAEGAVKALSEKTSLPGRDVLILGAGGAARAIGFGVREKGAKIHIAGRSAKKGRALADVLGGRYVSIDDVSEAPRDILVNATSVGMHPDTDRMPIPVHVLSPQMTVMDIVYNPLRTRLLSAAEERGAQVIDGAAMFVHQGAAQFALWTGTEAPAALMKQAAYEALGR
jgi:shikimate dehydrogenase